MIGTQATALRQEPEAAASLDGVLRGLANADDRNGIAELVVNYTAQRFQRSALFLIKGGKATGWCARVARKPVAGFEAAEISLAEPSVLRVVAETRNYYLGPMPVTPGNSKMVAALGGTPSLNNLLVPLMMVGRVVAVLYVDGGNAPMDETVTDLQRLLGKASMAFEILILKSKILLP